MVAERPSDFLTGGSTHSSFKSGRQRCIRDLSSSSSLRLRSIQSDGIDVGMGEAVSVLRKVVSFPIMTMIDLLIARGENVSAGQCLISEKTEVSAPYRELLTKEGGLGRNRRWATHMDNDQHAVWESIALLVRAGEDFYSQDPRAKLAKPVDSIHRVFISS